MGQTLPRRTWFTRLIREVYIASSRTYGYRQETLRIFRASVGLRSNREEGNFH